MLKVLENITVLVADDAVLNIMVMRQVLSEAGANVLTACNGYEVLRILGEHPVDVLLTDLQMPELDGYETTYAIRNGGQHFSTIPIIAVTGETRQEEIDKCMAAGMNDFISKPFIPQVICNKVLALHQQRKAAPEAPGVEQAATGLYKYDLSYLRDVANGDSATMLLFAENLQQNGLVLLHDAKDAAAAGRWKDAAGLLHKLKGLVGMFFMGFVTTALGKAESLAKQEEVQAAAIFAEIEKVGAVLPTIIHAIMADAQKDHELSAA